MAKQTKVLSGQATIEVGDDTMILALPPKTFKSGNAGFWNQQRFALSDGRTAQVQVTVTIKPA